MSTIASLVLLLVCYCSATIHAQTIATIGGRVEGLNLIQGNTSIVLANLVNGTVVTIATGSRPNLSVDAVTTGSVTSVQFSYGSSNNLFRNELTAPWAMCGNTGPRYTRCSVLTLGNHTVGAKTNTGSFFLVTFRIVAAAAVVVPIGAPAIAPVVTVTKAPIPLPTKTPTVAPKIVTRAPVVPLLTKAPMTGTPVRLSTKTPVLAPNTKAPVSVPTKIPSKTPTVAPVVATTTAPRASPVANNTPILSSPMRINCGGLAYTDSLGRAWRADSFFTGGSTYAQLAGQIRNTTDDVIYRSERYGVSRYDIAVPTPGRYSVVLHMAEIYFTTAQSRIFDIDVEGTMVSDIDLVQMGGVSMTALQVKVTVFVADGNLTISLLDNVPRVDNAKLNGIEVLPYDPAAPTPGPKAAPTAAPTPSTAVPVFEPVLINCGGSVYIDTQRRLWEADTFFTGSWGVVDNSALAIADTDEDSLYSSYRFGPMEYRIPVKNGLYEVVLYFAETYFATDGMRVFDVSVERTQIADIDIVELGGGLNNLAIKKMVSAIVNDGILTITFVRSIDNPLISAIEVNRIGGVPPTNPPVIAPPSPAPVARPFETILINCGGIAYNDTEGRLWSRDRFFNGGGTFFNNRSPIFDTLDDPLYFSERYGAHTYEIPVPLGSYEVILHFAETYFLDANMRVFDVNVENEETLENLDIVRESGQANKALKISLTVPVMDRFLTIQFKLEDPAVNVPKVSAIEVRRAGDHFAHAVIGGPYTAVDVDDDGFALVPVDATQSHTHGPTHVLTAFTWRIGTDIVGTGKVTVLSLPVGEHELTLTIADSSGSISSDNTRVVVKQKGFPELFSLSPLSGDIAGGTVVTITGQDIGNATSVRFGRLLVPRHDITVVDSGTIRVASPGPAIGVPVRVSVITTIGESNTVKFTFVSSKPIDFAVSKLLNLNKPTAVAFGPDGKLYIATQDGTLSRITLNESYDAVVASVTTTVDARRCILGIAFDPLETPEMGASISVYISSSFIYHGQFLSSSGNAVNGKVQKVQGPNLDVVTDIITGLPVSEIDHSVNAIYFGNNGELYIGTGSNTNAGFPGGIMGSGRQLENYFSAAVLVANIGQPLFNGAITYDAPNNGNPITGFGPNGVEIFASGTRNPFGVTMHSNGKVYATDNGPNKEYGPVANGCSEATDKLPGVTETDKLLLLKKGGYYGHPNHKRALSDPRQCIWRSNNLPSVDGYTAPLMKVQSSTCGIIEFESDHFDGQMRGDLILSKYNSELYRVILSGDGEALNPFSNPAIPLEGSGGLAVTQAPDGSLIDVRHTDGQSHVFKPVEAVSSALDVTSVFPRRGGLAGGSKLMIFGVNFIGSPVVTVGGAACTNVVVDSPKKISCILPPGTVGRKDVTVTIGTATDTFAKGYRYITGLPL